jgi:EmrB/QacA subfamily drug resistance transporter
MDRDGGGETEVSVTTQRIRRWWPLVAICTGTFMLLIDVTIVNVALPAISVDLRASFTQLQWVLDVYALALASLVLAAGSLADLYGRRRVYLVGLVLFAIASLACGLAPSAELLLGARTLQGLGGAAMFATTVALVNNSYEGRDRGTAFAVWGGVAGAAAALGPIIGGALTELHWRWIFLINLPVCAMAVVLTMAVVRESRQPEAPRPDVAGIALFTVGSGALMWGLVHGSVGGWGRPDVWGPLVAAVLFLTAWVLVECRQPAPMLDVRLFRRRNFSGIMLGAVLMNFSAFLALLYGTVWLQSIEGLSPLQAGLVYFPMSAVTFGVSICIGRALVSWPSRYLFFTGLLLVALGSLLLALVVDGANWVMLLPGLVVLGFGVGVASPTVAFAALGAVPRERSGMASGAVNTARQLGFAVGIAVLGTVFTAGAGAALREAGRADAVGLVSALSAGQAPLLIAAVDEEARASLTELLSAAYVDGLRGVFLTASGAALIGALVVVVLVRTGARDDSAAPSRTDRGGT